MKQIHRACQRIERAICNLPSDIYWLMRFFTVLASVAFVSLALIMLTVMVYFQHNFSAFKTLVIVAVTIVSCALLKNIIKKPRPQSEYSRQMFFKTYSFPSGHASSAMALYGSLTFWLIGQSSWIVDVAIATSFAVVIVLIGVSRVYLRAHYLSDVLAGWLLGGMVLLIFNLLI